MRLLNFDHYFFRYLISSIFSFLLTAFLVTFFKTWESIGIELSFFFTQALKAMLFFYLQKFYTFRNYDGDISKQLKYYAYTLIFFKSLEFLLLLLGNIIIVNYFLNIFIVLSFTSILKYYVFKFIFLNKEIY